MVCRSPRSGKMRIMRRPHSLRSRLFRWFFGAIVLAICDTLARTLLASNHLPTGAVTAVLGVPVFFAILLANKRRAALWGAAA